MQAKWKDLAVSQQTGTWGFPKGLSLSTNSEPRGLPVTRTDFWAPTRFVPSQSPGVGHGNCSEEETEVPSAVYARWSLRATARAVVFKVWSQTSSGVTWHSSETQRSRPTRDLLHHKLWGGVQRSALREAPGDRGATSLQTISLKKGLPVQIPARSFTSQVTSRWWWRCSL